jgi:hypothetical protein
VNEPTIQQVADKLRIVADEHQGVCCHASLGHLRIARMPQGFRVTGFRRDFSLEFDAGGNLRSIGGPAKLMTQAACLKISDEAPKVIVNSEGWPKEWLAVYPQSDNRVIGSRQD